MSWANDGEWEDTSVGNNLHVYLIEIIAAIAERLTIVSSGTWNLDAFIFGRYLTPDGTKNVPILEDFNDQALEQSWFISTGLAELLVTIQTDFTFWFFPAHSETTSLWGTRWMTTNSGGPPIYSLSSVIDAAGFGSAWLVFDPSTKDPKPLLQLKAILDLLIYPEWNLALDSQDTSDEVVSSRFSGAEPFFTNISSMIWDIFAGSRYGHPDAMITVTTSSPHPFLNDSVDPGLYGDARVRGRFSEAPQVIHIWNNVSNSNHHIAYIVWDDTTHFSIEGTVEGDVSNGWDKYHRLEVGDVHRLYPASATRVNSDRIEMVFDEPHPFAAGELWRTEEFFVLISIVVNSMTIQLLDVDEGTMSLTTSFAWRIEETDWDQNWADLVVSTEHAESPAAIDITPISKASVEISQASQFASVVRAPTWTPGALYLTVDFRFERYKTDMIKGTLLQGYRVWWTDLSGIDGGDPPGVHGVFDLNPFPDSHGKFRDVTSSDTFIHDADPTNPSTEIHVNDVGTAWPNVDGTNTPGPELEYVITTKNPFAYGDPHDRRVFSVLKARPYVREQSGFSVLPGAGSRAYTDIKSILTYITP